MGGRRCALASMEGSWIIRYAIREANYTGKDPIYKRYKLRYTVHTCQANLK